MRGKDMDNKVIFIFLIIGLMFSLGCSSTIDSIEPTTTTTSTTTTTMIDVYSLCLIDGEYVRFEGDCPR
jgi:hypothetical protein